MHNIINLDVVDAEELTEPVTLTEAKNWLKIDWVDQDAEITRLITSCREAVEQYTNCSLASKSVKCTVELCGDDFELPYGPVKEFTIEEDNLIDGQFKKVTGLTGKHTFDYTVGYSPCPPRLKEAILNEIAYRNQNRGDQSKELSLSNTFLCESTVHMCQPYKRMSWL